MNVNFLPRGVSIILHRNGRAYVSRRINKHGDQGLWQFPGGHVESGEHERLAAAREVLEETGLTIDPMRLTLLGITPPIKGYSGEWYLGYRYGYELSDTEIPQTTEPHKNTVWVALTFEDILDLPFLPMNKEYLSMVMPDPIK